jgi:hypothetical protein
MRIQLWSGSTHECWNVADALARRAAAKHESDRDGLGVEVPGSALWGEPGAASSRLP